MNSHVTIGHPRLLLLRQLAVIIIAIATFPLCALSQTEQVSWTVTGTGTETWNTDTIVYKQASASASAYIGDYPPPVSVNVPVTVTGPAYYSYSINGGLYGGSAYASISQNVFYLSYPSGHSGWGNNLTFTARSGTTYTVTAGAASGGGASIVVSFPDYVQHNPHTATRTATAYGNGAVTATDRPKNFGGFYAPPQPQNGGTISGVTYSVSSSNPNVFVFFSDTGRTTSVNPYADIQAVIKPPAPDRILISSISLTNAVFKILPPTSANNVMVATYCAAGITNATATGPGAGWLGVGPLQPETSYTFSFYEHDPDFNVNGPTNLLNVTTLPLLECISVASVSMTNVVFQILPQLLTNYEIWGYDVTDGVTNRFGTGPGAGWMGVGPLLPGTPYTFYLSKHNISKNITGPAIATDVTTLPLQGISVASLSPTNVVFQILPQLSTNYWVNTYYVANGVTNRVGTGVGPGWMGLGPLLPDTTYTFTFYVVDVASGANSAPVSSFSLTTPWSPFDQPYQGVWQTVPGRVHVERYDEGGEGVAYHSPFGTNYGSYRTNETITAGYNSATGDATLAYTIAGEWVNYSINVLTSRTYSLALWNGVVGAAGTEHIEIDGTNVTGHMTVPVSGNWSVHLPVKADNVYLAAGHHILRLVMDANTIGEVSAIDVVDPVQITQQPLSQTNAPESNAGFSVAATGYGLTYQWQFNGTNLPGATGPSLSLTNLAPSQAGPYQVICSNLASVVTSAAAQLTVQVPAIQGLSVSSLGSTNVIFKILPPLSTNYWVNTYYAANGVTNRVGTGAGPGWMGFGPLLPDTTYTFTFYVVNIADGLSSAAVTTNITTLQRADYNRVSGKLLGNSQMRLSFVGAPLKNYVLERSSSLAPVSWEPQATNATDLNGALVFTNQPKVGTNSFWRIRSVP